VEVILLEKITRLGNLGDQVKVRAGFGRNFLIPQGKALPATPANIEIFNARRSELEALAAKQLEASTERAKALEGLQLSIAVNASEEGKLFGSVGRHEIVDALKEQGHEVEKKEISLETPIREIGEYEVSLALLGDEVLAKIQITVTAA